MTPGPTEDRRDVCGGTGVARDVEGHGQVAAVRAVVRLRWSASVLGDAAELDRLQSCSVAVSTAGQVEPGARGSAPAFGSKRYPEWISALTGKLS